MKAALFFVIFSVFLMGCLSENSHEMGEFTMVSATASDANVLIPKFLVTRLEQEYLKNFKITNPYDVRSDAQILARVPRHFLNVSVWLEARGGLGIDDDYEFKIARGGGVIDLSDYVTRGRGNFLFRIHVKHNTEGESKLVSGLKVYFVSHSKKRKIGKSTFGAGCNKIIEITDYYHSTISQEGVLVNTTDQRYLSVLGGTFFFSYIDQAQLNFATLEVRDRRFDQYTCFPESNS